MTYIFRPNAHVVTDSALARVYQAGGAAVLLPFCDYFNRPDEALIAPWVQKNGTFSVVSNKAAATALSPGIGLISPNTAIVTVDAETDSVRITYKITYNNLFNAYIGIVGRYRDANNYNLIGHSPDGNGFRIIKVVGGILTNIVFSNLAPPIPNGTEYPGECSFNGANISATFRGITISTAAGGDFVGETLFGLYTEDTGNIFDDFCIDVF